MEHTRAFVWTSWGLRLVVAAILFQTLFFKFSGAKESVYIFSTLGVEPWGRIGSGIFELAACVLLVVPSTAALGALMAVAATGSAIVLHLTKLGVALTAVGDHGELFALAVVVVLCSSGILAMHRRDVRGFGRLLHRYTGATRKEGVAAAGG